ncbi:hypothetical protein BCR39DRAFT_525440 [Naematelia encephala]|uniref:G-patch domain-containing protein n=1 Tax=Naematelia encephala TaxID=71784 RepID=A0A1Y2BAC7_9TREE|nr:hypothetical protein BCR39DRAFT_525440 [Naematelia encephala]
MTTTKSRFDPAAHLTKQGWKGKGTALKHGHITRPIAVVQKKSLSGIGKDRDEAAPFWDQIFASTAATLFTTPTESASPTPSGSPGPSAWATLSHLDAGRPQPTPKVRQRVELRVQINQESARRGLYSRFVRGVELKQEEPKWEQEVPGLESQVIDAGPSQYAELEGKNSERGKESKEEKRARKEERARRKAEREERRQRKAANTIAETESKQDTAKSPADNLDTEVQPSKDKSTLQGKVAKATHDDIEGGSEKVKRKRRKDEESGLDTKKKKKKGREGDKMSNR